MAFYLRFEGVNLSSFIYDAEDLSVSRGGSLALLNAPERVKTRLLKEFPGRVEDVNLGASSGIFRINADTSATGAAEASVRSFLEQDTVCRHATFVVDTALDTDAFSTDRARLMGLNRWRQMQTQSLIYPQEPETPAYGTDKKYRICQLDQVRPAATETEHWDFEAGKRKVEVRSRSSHDRHEHGRCQKKKFFECEIQRARGAVPGNLEFNFTNDLNTLAGHRTTPDKELQDKIALIYLDGNSFGKKFAESCRSPEEQRAKSALLRKEQAGFLCTLVERIAAAPKQSDWFYEKNDENGHPAHQARLEILLWGGDEICLAVPAWQGWFTLDLFFKLASAWTTFPTLSHAAGIVFCSRKCHIHRAKQLAKQLAELGKKELKRPKEERLALPETDLVAYQVLESFDYLSGTPDWEYQCAAYPFLDAAMPNVLLLPGKKLEAIGKQIGILRNEMPRRQLHNVIRSLMSNGGLPKEADDTLKEITAAARDAFGLLNGACVPAPSLAARHEELVRKAAWIHLQELWDYAGLESAGRGKDEA
jgi:hypothetical protein